MTLLLASPIGLIGAGFKPMRIKSPAVVQEVRPNMSSNNGRVNIKHTANL